MTDIELIEKVIKILDNISVPAALTKQISLPIVAANEYLRALLNAAKKTAAELKEKEQEQSQESNEDEELMDDDTKYRVGPEIIEE